jgi:outer membrane protein OmpA-like peptidoglycan-associated protein
MTKSSAYVGQIALILGLAVGASGCSTISDLDPTGLLGSDSDNAPASQFPDQTAPTASDQDVGTTPDLASLPARPAPTATPADSQQTTQSLASDGAQARYSADALRGGTEAAAPPPTASDAAPTAAQRILGTQAQDTPPTAEAAPPSAQPTPQTAAAAPPPAVEPAAAPAPQMAAAAPPPPTAEVSPPPPVSAGAQPAVPASAPVQTAALPNAVTASPVGPSAGSAAVTPPPGAEPAVPAKAPVRGTAMMAQSTASDAALGFKPSSAPPLDPSIGQFVSAPIVAQYRQTASNSVTVNPAAIPAVPPKGARAGSDNGAVVANLDAVSSGPGRIAAMNGGVPPTAVVYFPGDGVKLSKAAHAQVRAAVTAFKADGGQGTIRVVGHASSRTPNMPVEKHLETIFSKSQERADAVAQELIHQGVPAAKILIDAVGDSQPIYYESMPKGEDGNRRAEIFVQG